MNEARRQQRLDTVCDRLMDALRALRVDVLTIGIGGKTKLVVYHRSAKIPANAPGLDGSGVCGFTVRYEKIGAVIPCALNGSSKTRANRAVRAAERTS